MTAALSVLVLMLVAGSAVAQDDWDDGWDEALPIEIHGFVEAAGGARVVDDPAQPDDFVLGEARFRLDLAHYTDLAETAFKGDFIQDAILDDFLIDIRTALVVMHFANWFDLRAGRQILTWGTGDFVFVNDLFPKDWVSFFIGRADEFLKAPSNSLKFSFYSANANLDVVWTPIFTPDRFITGERLSFFDPSASSFTSATIMGQPLDPVAPAKEIDNSELAARLYGTAAGYELALYGYGGFTRRPLAYHPVAMKPTYSRLGVYGGSVRGNLFGGIANIEAAFYDSRGDRDGNNPNVPNSQVRGLAGYEFEAFANFTVGLQYYGEYTLDYDSLTANSPWPQFEPDELRQWITTRFNWRLLQDTLLLSFFAFIGIDERDTHMRPLVSYRWTDAVTLDTGANIMYGRDDHTFFGQLENNTNVYARIRYSF